MRSHEENREKVCVLCFEKVKHPKRVHQSLKQVIVENFLTNYTVNNEIYPKVLCGSCYIAVYRCSKGNL